MKGLIWLAAASLAVAIPAHAQSGAVVKMAGCGAAKVAAEHSAKEWRKLIASAPVAATWTRALRNWSHANALGDDQCMMVYRLQRAARAYGQDAKVVDWLHHADMARRRGMASEAKGIVNDQASAGDPLTQSTPIYDLRQQIYRDLELEKGVTPRSPSDPIFSRWSQSRIAAEARFWLNREGWSQATQIFALANVKGPFDAGIEAERGYALFRAGNAAAAKQAFERAKSKGKGFDRDVAEFWLLFLAKGVR